MLSVGLEDKDGPVLGEEKVERRAACGKPGARGLWRRDFFGFSDEPCLEAGGFDAIGGIEFFDCF